VYTSNHPDFAFGPHIPKGQDLEQRGDPMFFGNAPMLVSAGPGRDDYDEWEKTSPVVQKLRNSRSVQDESNAKRQVWMQTQSKRAIERATKAGMDTSRIVETYNLALQQGLSGSYRLYEDFVLYGPRGAFTVKDALDDPAKYHKMKIDNPFEPGTGWNKTLLYTLNQTHGPAIHTYAHGEMTFRLLRDTATDLDGLERPSWLGEDGEIDREALKEAREAAEATAEDAGGALQEDATGEDEDDGEPANESEDRSVKNARVLALRAALFEGVDAASTEKRIKQKWPQLAGKAAEIAASAQREVEKWKPGATRTINGVRKRVTSVDQLNQSFVLLMLAGQPSAVVQIKDALFLTMGDFAARLGDSVIVTRVDKDMSVKANHASKVWIADCRRRIAKKIVFTSRKVSPECLNLWTGFGVTPTPGGCPRIYQHIYEVICAGRDRENKALLDLIAWQAQNIGRASRIIADFYSPEQQVGKGVLLEKILTPMYGLHGAFVSDADKVFGRFNDAVCGKAFIAFDEACFAGDRKLADKIKSASATENTAIEKKGLPVISCPTAVNYFMATNHAHSAYVEQHDARYWILKASPHRIGDDAYWAELFKEIDGGGVSAFLHDMLTRDVSNFVPGRDVPRDNEEHRANKLASEPAHPALWLRACLNNNLWLGSEKWEGVCTVDGGKKEGGEAIQMFDAAGTCGLRLLPYFLTSAYRNWAKEQGRHAQPVMEGEFWKLMTGVGALPRKTNRGRYRVIPSQDVLRQEIEKMLGVEAGAAVERRVALKSIAGWMKANGLGPDIARRIKQEAITQIDEHIQEGGSVEDLLDESRGWLN
jgi:hypothetical protein